MLQGLKPLLFMGLDVTAEQVAECVVFSVILSEAKNPSSI
jgi:hypothetical protein